jgi:hypothetical protein
VSSAIKQHFTLATASTVKFDYNIFTILNPDAQNQVYPETIVAVLDGQAYFVSDTDTATFSFSDPNVKWQGYKTFSGLPVLGAGDHDLSIAAVGAVASAGVEVDNVVTTAVPEPATVSVLGLAAAGLLLRRRRAS